MTISHRTSRCGLRRGPADNSSVECAKVVTDLMATGIKHHTHGRFARAVACYADALAMLPEHGEAWRLLGVAALQAGDTQSARSLLERALRIDAGDAAAHSALGSLAESEGDLVAAYIDYAAASALDPGQPAASSGLTRVALARGEARHAIVIGEAGVARGSRDAALFRALSAARLEIGDYAGAVHASVRALRIAPHADAYANLGAACLHLHRLDAAVAFCEEALALDPTHAKASNNLGIAYKAQGAFSVALTEFARAIALGSEEAHANLGTTRLLLGDYGAGWPEYGWTNPERRTNPASAELPMWDGACVRGLRLLIWRSKGSGIPSKWRGFSRRRALALEALPSAVRPERSISCAPSTASTPTSIRASRRNSMRSTPGCRPFGSP